MAALLDVSAPYVQLLVCVQFGSQIFFNLLFSASQYSSAPLVPVSLVPPLPSLSLLSFLSRSPLRARGLVRFLVPRRIVRLEHLESADCETADLLPSCVCFFSFLLPASSTLGRRLLGSETKFVGRLQRGRLDAAVHLQSPCRSIFSRILSLLRRILDTCRLPPTDLHTTDKAPVYRRGGRHKKLNTGSLTLTAHETIKVGVKELQSHPGGYNI